MMYTPQPDFWGHSIGKGVQMAIVRAVPRNSVALILSALLVAASIMFAAVYSARGGNHDQTFYGCLFAGSLSQVNTTAPPANCGRGQQVSWNSQGIQGLPGTDGVSGYEIVYSEPVEVGAGAGQVDGLVQCPMGKVAIGGGAAFSDSQSSDGMLLKESHALSYGSGWRASVRNDSGATFEFQVQAICAFMAPAPTPTPAP
jgi:hypothetical protein